MTHACMHASTGALGCTGGRLVWQVAPTCACMHCMQLCALLFCWTGLLGAAGGCQALVADCMARRCRDPLAAAHALPLRVVCSCRWPVSGPAYDDSTQPRLMLVALFLLTAGTAWAFREFAPSADPTGY